MKNYKKLYLQATEDVSYWIKRCDELKQEEREVEPYCIEVYLKDGGMIDFENAINHKIDNYPCVYYQITTADGLVSYFKYEEVKYILAYRKVENE